MLQREWILAIALLAAGTLVSGCSSKKIQSEVPKAAPAAQVKMAASGHYTVANHDTLWGIAGKFDIYSDNFQWPLIFKSNRDVIKDPDLIYPQQEFSIDKNASSEEMSHAKDLAMKTPKFVPHSKPRQALPLDYF
jgi:LysM repeat protein